MIGSLDVKTLRHLAFLTAIVAIMAGSDAALVFAMGAWLLCLIVDHVDSKKGGAR